MLYQFSDPKLPNPLWQPNVMPNKQTPTLPTKGTSKQSKDSSLKIKRTGVYPK